MKEITKKQAERFAKKMGLRWESVDYTIKDLTQGMNVELEHGKRNPLTNVTNDSITKTGKIALAHLMEHPKYYVELAKMEKRLGI